MLHVASSWPMWRYRSRTVLVPGRMSISIEQMLVPKSQILSKVTSVKQQSLTRRSRIPFGHVPYSSRPLGMFGQDINQTRTDSLGLRARFPASVVRVALTTEEVSDGAFAGSRTAHCAQKAGIETIPFYSLRLFQFKKLSRSPIL